MSPPKLRLVPAGHEPLSMASEVLKSEGNALIQIADRLDGSFLRVVQRIEECHGRLAVSGVGKSAAVAQKLTGTFNSTGTRAYFLDATAALHGDLGMVHPDDVALLISHSGASSEITRLVPALRSAASSIMAITGKANSPLATAADHAIVYGDLQEACPLSLAPSTSCIVAMALGDALAFVLASRRGFRREDFARNHPAGSLGLHFSRVDEHMRTGIDLRVASTVDSVRQVLAQTTRSGRRTGAVMLVDGNGRLAGLFTDSDLARLLERDKNPLDLTISDVMTRDPWTVLVGTRLEEAMDVLSKNKISELPVVDETGRPVGLLDVTDLVATLPMAGSCWGDERGRQRRSA